ncbi:hypothetical protein BX616_007954 [Lobosporangium transversale]|uniref:Uncharacterized protein n=1 Tax=Lobosporangium transversale TaxID=64571 RepID=A0A1Y2GYH4_9FUNG|nr:hypothetical protein BCR41DRAFT_392655 [Lobosporangium transversale]KAF9914600.1 hypothetical protein BX616_007954 [Lobosporangium transversale]ORZ27327.1 hypothetical protein BCR41DRAFT_392655 [Lobosporangium transversale]|eukprot:XP_021885054.1 hypothetical protein BCR41DRAFT_392655 [Lobosporangium transversale]
MTGIGAGSNSDQLSFPRKLIQTSRMMNDCEDQIKTLERLIHTWDELVAAKPPSDEPNTLDASERQQAMGILANLRSRLRIQLDTKASLLASMRSLMDEHRGQARRQLKQVGRKHSNKYYSGVSMEQRKKAGERRLIRLGFRTRRMDICERRIETLGGLIEIWEQLIAQGRFPEILEGVEGTGTPTIAPNECHGGPHDALQQATETVEGLKSLLKYQLKIRSELQKNAEVVEQTQELL